MSIENQSINQVEGNQLSNEQNEQVSQIQRELPQGNNSSNLIDAVQGIIVQNNQNEIQINQKEHKYTFSFLMFFILNTLCLIHSYIPGFELTDYSLCLWPVLNKSQYYRILTNHFYHSGFSHYITNITALYFITKRLEREIGTLYTLIIGFHSIIIISFIYLFAMFIFKLILRLTMYNFNSICGCSSICFTYFIFYYLLNKNKNKTINLVFFSIRGIYFSIFLLKIFLILMPNSSYIGHLSGIASAVMIYEIFSNFSLPKVDWVNDMEKVVSVKSILSLKRYLGYICAEENENVKENLKEISRFLNFDKCKEKLGVIQRIERVVNSRNDESNDNSVVNSNENNRHISNEMTNLPELEQRHENQDTN